MDEKEEMLAAIASLKAENQALRAEARQARQLLRGLEALLAVEPGEDAFRSVFSSLWSTFEFDQAMVLAEQDERLACVVADPAELVGSLWPKGALFSKIVDGRVTAVFSHEAVEEWRDLTALPQLDRGQPGLYMPLRIRQRRGILVLLRRRGAESFSREDVALGRRFCLLASHALASLDARQRIEANRARALAAEEANRTKSMFLANMSHELRTPLNAILGFSELIERETLGPIGNVAYREYAGDIRWSGHHLLAIVNNLLLLSRIEAGQYSGESVAVGLAGELSSAVRLLEFDLGKREVTVEIAGVPADMVVYADPLAIRQMLLNLIGNAVKFSPAGSRVRVFLAPAEPGDGPCLKIEDHGCGIPPEVLSRLGTPFVQAEDAYVRGQQGTGLGLAICLRLAESMGIGVAIDSEPGRGTTVGLAFPARVPEQAGAAAS